MNVVYLVHILFRTFAFGQYSFGFVRIESSLLIVNVGSRRVERSCTNLGHGSIVLPVEIVAGVEFAHVASN